MSQWVNPPAPCPLRVEISGVRVLLPETLHSGGPQCSSLDKAPSLASSLPCPTSSLPYCVSWAGLRGHPLNVRTLISGCAWLPLRQDKVTYLSESLAYILDSKHPSDFFLLSLSRSRSLGMPSSWGQKSSPSSRVGEW